MPSPVANLPKSIQRVIDHGVKLVDPERVILYGSRARGDAHPASDFDLAFVGNRRDQGNWARFVVDVDEEPLTLYPVDLVLLDEVSQELREKIKKEGVVVYERSQQGQ